MARVWQGLLRLGLDGTAPLFVLQTLLFYGGLALVFGALPKLRPGIAVAAAVALVVAADWTTVVVKDAQMVAALTMATGVVAAFRIRAQRLPGWATAAVVLLLGYALLLRANAVFAVVPLAVLLTAARRPAKAGTLCWICAAACVTAIGLTPLVNHRLLGSHPSHVERVLPIFDLAGIVAYGGAVPPTDPAIWHEMTARKCYSPVLWDALGDDGRCGFVADRLGLGGPSGAGLMRRWAAAIAANPVAYARHRFAHLNATLRWLVPLGQPNAGAPPDSQPNAYDLGARATWRTEVPAWLARTLAATPLGWPAAWLAASLGLWTSAAATPRGPARDLALALFVSAATMTLSFVVVSIASDLRYHLWAMIATTLGAVVLTTAPGVPRRRVVATGVVVAIVAAMGLGARIILPTGAWG